MVSRRRIGFGTLDGGLMAVTGFIGEELDAQAESYDEPLTVDEIEDTMIDAFETALTVDLDAPQAEGAFWPLYWAVFREFRDRPEADRTNPAVVVRLRKLVYDLVGCPERAV